MGQKVNPYGIRLGINKLGHQMVFKEWIYKTIASRFKNKKLCWKKIKKCKYFKNQHWKSKEKLRLSIYSSRPGIIIGKKGADIETLKKDLSKLSGLEVFLDIKEVRKPEVEAKLVAENIASQLEKEYLLEEQWKKLFNPQCV